MKKESIDKLQTIYTKLMQIDETTLAEMITEVVRAETVITKVGKFSFYDFVSKEECGEVMQGVYHDDGFKVASDGRILIAIREEYNKDFEGKILAKDGSFIKRCYPRWRCVIPQEEGEFYEIDESKFTEQLAKKRAEYKMQYVKAKRWDSSWVVKIGGAYYSAEYFAKVLTAMKYIGITKVQLVGNDAKMLLHKSDDAILILMPRYVTENDVADYSIIEL
jgi:hypothetical protein